MSKEIVYANGIDRRVSSRSNQLRTDGENIFIGEKPNITQFSLSGLMRFLGTATVWDEISQSFIGNRLLVSAGRVDYNYDELTVDFSDNARYPDEPVGIVIQLPHARQIDSDIRPHIHWMQTNDSMPNILVEYRWCNNGEVSTNWALKALTADDAVFDYTEDGMQITNLNLPEGNGVGKGLSSTFECKVYRDSANASGLFAGNDPYTGDWSVKYYDIHVLKDMLGSDDEFIK